MWMHLTAVEKKIKNEIGGMKGTQLIISALLSLLFQRPQIKHAFYGLIFIESGAV